MVSAVHLDPHMAKQSSVSKKALVDSTEVSAQ